MVISGIKFYKNNDFKMCVDLKTFTLATEPFAWSNDIKCLKLYDSEFA